MKREESRMLQQESKGGRGRVCRGETKGKDRRESQREMSKPEPKKTKRKREGGAQCQQHYKKTNETTIRVRLVLKGRRRHAD